MNFTPFPELKTERLILRQLDHNDAEEMFYLRSSKEVMRYISRPLAITIEDAISNIDLTNTLIRKNEAINWGIALKENNRLIGTIGYVRMKKEDYRAEIGYMLNPDFHRKGLMQEALKEIIDYGFNKMKLHSIEAVIDPDNTASGQLLEKNNFTADGFFKENCFFEGKFYDSKVYSLLNPE